MSGRRVPAVAKAVLVVAVASVVLGAGLFVASTAYAEFGGVKAAADTTSWASRPLKYSASACIQCHLAEAAEQASNKHGGIGCETCHGLVGGHPGTDPAAVKPLAKPTGELCVQCHAMVVGRPAAFPQIDPAKHYTGGSGEACLRCHDPHAVMAVVPPKITHPLEGLPACTTCHRPDGLKKVPAGHELVADAVCLTCHRPLEAKP